MSTVPDNSTYLIVEDDVDFATMMTDALGAQGMKTLHVTNAVDAVAKLRNQVFGCIILDMRLENDTKGEDVILAARNDRKDANFNTPIIVTSGYLDADMVVRIGQHVAGVLVKPFGGEALLTKIHSAIATRKPA